jgi:hypothetical protein
VASLLFRTFSPAGASARLSIFIFHRVLPAADPLLPFEPSVEQFDWMVRLISRNFNVLPLSAAARRLQAGTLPTAAAAITFDDGYADNFEVAWPILAHYGIPATFFIATAFLDGGRMWNDEVIEAFRKVPEGELNLHQFDLGSHAARYGVANSRLRGGARETEVFRTCSPRRGRARDQSTSHSASAWRTDDVPQPTQAVACSRGRDRCPHAHASDPRRTHRRAGACRDRGRETGSGIDPRRNSHRLRLPQRRTRARLFGTASGRWSKNWDFQPRCQRNPGSPTRRRIGFNCRGLPLGTGPRNALLAALPVAALE